jgi:hypothetical protein
MYEIYVNFVFRPVSHPQDTYIYTYIYIYICMYIDTDIDIHTPKYSKN